jgi:hypothetical protein
MATYSKQLLSGSTNGRPIPVVATATAGTLVHTSVASPAIDEVWLYVVNTSSSAVLVTIEFGGVSSPGDTIVKEIPANTIEQVVPGLPISNALVVRAFAAVASVLNVVGFVNRIA